MAAWSLQRALVDEKLSILKISPCPLSFSSGSTLGPEHGSSVPSVSYKQGKSRDSYQVFVLYIQENRRLEKNQDIQHSCCSAQEILTHITISSPTALLNYSDNFLKSQLKVQRLYHICSPMSTQPRTQKEGWCKPRPQFLIPCHTHTQSPSKTNSVFPSKILRRDFALDSPSFQPPLNQECPAETDKV